MSVWGKTVRTNVGGDVDVLWDEVEGLLAGLLGEVVDELNELLVHGTGPARGLAPLAGRLFGDGQLRVVAQPLELVPAVLGVLVGLAVVQRQEAPQRETPALRLVLFEEEPEVVGRQRLVGVAVDLQHIELLGRHVARLGHAEAVEHLRVHQLGPLGQLSTVGQLRLVQLE